MKTICNTTIGYLYTLLILAFCFSSQVSYGQAWEIKKNMWSVQDEEIYGNFVTSFCDSKHNNLTEFIRDKTANPLYTEEDKKFSLKADCADLPYVIRAYVAYKLRLPFSHVHGLRSSEKGDERYRAGNRPAGFKSHNSYSSPQHLFNAVRIVNSGYYRMASGVENSDFYPVKVHFKSIKPGTVYYDPDGHVAIVGKVERNGRIRLIDGHPDLTVSKPWFGKKFARGSSKYGGGFKNWRPIQVIKDGEISRSSNRNISDFSATEQYQKSFNLPNQSGVSYYDYIKGKLSQDNTQWDPVSDLIFMFMDIYEDIAYRAMAVDVAIAAKIDKRPHPGILPKNIYGTDGVWEAYSTPSRDARLKVAFKEMYDVARSYIGSAKELYGKAYSLKLAEVFLAVYNDYGFNLGITYTNSVGESVWLSFDEVRARLFDLSFDPYHSIELRWGAKGKELASGKDSDVKKSFYKAQYRLRNNMERVYGVETPLTMGPERPADIDLRSWLMKYLKGKPVSWDFVEIRPEIVAGTDIFSSGSNVASDSDILKASLQNVSVELSEQRTLFSANEIAAVKKDEASLNNANKSAAIALAVLPKSEADKSEVWTPYRADTSQSQLINKAVPLNKGIEKREREAPNPKRPSERASYPKTKTASDSGKTIKADKIANKSEKRNPLLKAIFSSGDKFAGAIKSGDFTAP
ncbi:MAG: hypothetical protein GX221_04265 [Candidatus Riflebacteria bacterium]|nr:hypothetical protein [Candidatus Riflebacteria bacterium]